MLALKDAGFSFAVVQSDAFLPSCMRTIAFSIANCFDVLLYACPCVSDAPHQVAGVTDMCLVYCTHILHQLSNSVVDWVSRTTGLFDGHRSREIKSGVSC